MVVCNCSMFSCTLLYVHSSFAIILMGKRRLVALLSLSSWCVVMVERLFFAVPCVCLRFVIVVFPDHTHLLFLLLISRARYNDNYSSDLYKNNHICYTTSHSRKYLTIGLLVLKLPIK